MAMSAKNLPERWLDYEPLGTRIEGTRFIAFKVPLSKVLNNNVPKAKRFTIQILLAKVANLGMVVDLTNTTKYYNSEQFQNYQVEYVKVKVPGRIVPSKYCVTLFENAVDEFFSKNFNNDAVVGVHCTHGVNRTGFLICSYMINKMNMTPKEAILRFNKARGHDIERQNYIRTLHDIYGRLSHLRNRFTEETDETDDDKTYDESQHGKKSIHMIGDHPRQHQRHYEHKQQQNYRYPNTQYYSGNNGDNNFAKNHHQIRQKRPMNQHGTNRAVYNNCHCYETRNEDNNTYSDRTLESSGRYHHPQCRYYNHGHGHGHGHEHNHEHNHDHVHEHCDARIAQNPPYSRSPFYHQHQHHQQELPQNPESAPERITPRENKPNASKIHSDSPNHKHWK